MPINKSEHDAITARMKLLHEEAQRNAEQAGVRLDGPYMAAIGAATAAFTLSHIATVLQKDPEDT